MIQFVYERLKIYDRNIFRKRKYDLFNIRNNKCLKF